MSSNWSFSWNWGICKKNQVVFNKHMLIACFPSDKIVKQILLSIWFAFLQNLK